MIEFNYNFCAFFNNFKESTLLWEELDADTLLNNVSFIVGLMCILYKTYSVVGAAEVSALVVQKLNKDNINDYLFTVPFNKSTRQKIYARYAKLVEGVSTCQG